MFYAACDVGLVTLRATELFQDVLPSKIFEYLGMERPVIISVDGEARRLVEAAGAGRFVRAEDVGELVQAMVLTGTASAADVSSRVLFRA